MKYVNHKCPVCEKIFTEEDEVVVCPECGTPLVRYEGEAKHYKSLHKEGFVYKNENEKVDIPGENIDVIIENDVKNTSDVLEVVNIEYNENSPTDKENIKSTIEELFKSINGKSTEEFKDKDWDTYRNHSIGFVFQSYNLIPHQTVLANVELALTISGVSKEERRKRAKEALVKVGLGDQLNKKPNQRKLL